MMPQEELPMQALKLKLKTILDHINLRSRFVYLDIPRSFNVGDLLINIGTEAFFSVHGIRPEQRCCDMDIPRSIFKVDDNVTFLMQGGGNFGDLWPGHQSLREQILLKYPHNRVIFLPQTVYFANRANQTACCALLASHHNLHIFVRDESSFASLTDSGLHNVTLIPDMAHWLWGKMPQAHETDATRAGRPLYFFRRDKEKGSIPKEFRAEVSGAVDWGDCMSLWQKAAWAICAKSMVANRMGGRPLNLIPCWYALRNSMVQHGVSMLSHSDRIVTNRMHAMLLGLLLGKRVTAFDNSYGKLSSYVTTWLKNMPNLTFLDS